MILKEAIDETIDNSIRSDIDRRIIKHVDFDQEKLMRSLTQLIGSMADSNQVILKEDLESSKIKGRKAQYRV
jgi:hypothetical protein